MKSSNLARIVDLQDQLLKICMDWAWKKPWDHDRAAALRREAALALHSHYLENIPAYKKLAQGEGIGELAEDGPIKRNLMSTDTIFKSYDQQWLDDRDYRRMNQWLSSIFHEKVEADVEGVRTIDQWIERLTASGIIPAYSSGTTGAFSFVPRDETGWYMFTSAPACYLAPELLGRGFGSWWQRLIAKPGAGLLSARSFIKFAKNMVFRDVDGILLNFRKGNMGIQLVGQEFGKLFRRTHFLYDIDLMASALRCITRGARDEEDRKLLEFFQAETIGKKEQNYDNILGHARQSTSEGQKVFLFGAPYQLKELCQKAADQAERPRLNQGSFVIFGGGWKSFEGDRIEREDLVRMIMESFGVGEDMITEGYSMTEINGTLVRCGHGRFHIPPILEPVILDEELVPLEGKDLKGAFGFLDPLATSYPGFIISGDNVWMKDEPCACGLDGPALLEVGRAPGREVKGCGGIMASVRA